MKLLDFYKDVAIILAGIIAFTTFLSGLLEYARQGRQRKAETFLHMRRRFLETPLFQHILNLLATDSDQLCQVSIQDRRNFGGFLEEVAIMVDSKLLSPELAHYMFGYYVLLTARSEHFWEDLDRSGPYWRLFWRFAGDMERLEASPPPVRHIAV